MLKISTNLHLVKKGSSEKVSRWVFITLGYIWNKEQKQVLSMCKTQCPSKIRWFQTSILWSPSNVPHEDQSLSDT